MIAIPVFVQPMRTMISQYFIKHTMLLTGDAQRRAEIVANAAEQLAAVPMKGGGTNILEFEDQTFREISAGSSYWGAFAGAYGVAFGSLVSVTCIGGGESGP